MAVFISIHINYRNRVNKKGLYPVHIRVSIDSEIHYYPVKLPVKLTLEEWTGREQYWVAETNPYCFEINDAINKTRSRITDIHRSLYAQGRKLTFYHIDKALGFRGNRQIFNDYFKNYMRSRLQPWFLPMLRGRNTIRL